MTSLKKSWKWIALSLILIGILGIFGYQYYEIKKLERIEAEEYVAEQQALKESIALLNEEIAKEEKEEVDEDALKGITICSHMPLYEKDQEGSKVKDYLQRETIFSILENDSDSDYLKIDIENGRQGYVLKEQITECPQIESGITYYSTYDYSDLSTNPGYASVNLSYYQSIYPRCVGYIYGPGTPISYPIMWTGDDYYLHHDYNGAESVYGAIYLAKENSSSFSDSNSILYGHHMIDGSMFASISGYKNSSYYYSHPVLYLYTPSQNYRVEVVAGVVVPGTSELFCTGFSDAQWNTLLSNSTFTSRVGKPSGKTITLCTCSYEFDNGRYIIVGSLVPIS